MPQQKIQVYFGTDPRFPEKDLVERVIICIAVNARILQHVIDMEKKQRRGQHAALGNASVHGHMFRAKTVDSDWAQIDAAPSEKAGDPLA